MAEEDEKLKEFKENAQKQREKIRNVVHKEKEDDLEMEFPKETLKEEEP